MYPNNFGKMNKLKTFHYTILPTPFKKYLIIRSPLVLSYDYSPLLGPNILLVITFTEALNLYPFLELIVQVT